MTAETVAGLIVAMFSALVATAITGFLWLIKLGNRVSLLESGYSMLEKALEADPRDPTAYPTVYLLGKSGSDVQASASA